ncbi:MAG: CoA pyrophosphatase [Dehalococcoidales bacterium]|jgi:8-oxo-dGTP pyrophosphatase MutT (NUDIX family)
MEAELKEYLTKRPKKSITEASRIPSAVLIPIYKKNGQYHILFTKRSNEMKTHRGQISFPGGARHADDGGLKDTALREAEEEIGLKPEDVTVLGELDDEITTTSNFIVTPFVGMIPHPYRFRPNRAEVERLISVPLAALLDKDNMKPNIETLDGGIVVDSYDYYYRGNIIWGATARILNKLLTIISRLPSANRNTV